VAGLHWACKVLLAGTGNCLLLLLLLLSQLLLRNHLSTDCAFLMPRRACTSSSVSDLAILKASVLA
jgi:hypothetical protein